MKLIASNPQYVKASGKMLSGKCPVCGCTLNKHNYYLNGKDKPITCSRKACIKELALRIAEHRICPNDPDAKKGLVCEHRKNIEFYGGWTSMCTTEQRAGKGCE